MNLLHPTIKQLLQQFNAVLVAAFVAYIVMKLMPVPPVFKAGTTNFNYVQTFVVLYTMLSSFLCFRIYKKQLPVVRSGASLSDKLKPYKQLLFTELLLQSFALVLVLAAFWLTMHWSIELLLGFTWLMLFMQRPHPILAAGQLDVQRAALFGNW
ncbi:MAG TPA: hypothetical protein DCL43_05950 [Chitinophagaceae bacterium]|nr:hypothetical protein [Chitinophagaceae bacterium]HAN39773.1 hypothetical protein [Chitinophagaceae bacterium]